MKNKIIKLVNKFLYKSIEVKLIFFYKFYKISNQVYFLKFENKIF